MRVLAVVLLVFLAVAGAAPAWGVVYERHVFASVGVEASGVIKTVGGSSPGGSRLAVALTYYNGSTGLYEAAVVVEDVSEGIPAVDVVRLDGSSCDPAASVHATAVEAGDDGRVYVAGYASSEAGTWYFVALLEPGAGGGYGVSRAVSLDVLGGPVAGLELAGHPAYGEVLVALGEDSEVHVPVLLVLNSSDLRVIHALKAVGAAWNKNYVDSAGVAVAGDGSVVAAVTLSSQGHLALYAWNGSGYDQVYTVKYLNGLYVYDVAAWDGDGLAYAYVAGAKKSDEYTDWGTGADADPILLKIPLDAGAWLEGAAIEWALALDNTDDDYALAAAVHEAGVAAFAGYLTDEAGGLDYPFIALVQPNGSLAGVAVAPSPAGGATQEARGSYHALSTYQGYTVAAGTTQYTTASMGVGVLLYTPNISSQLNWTNAPPDWPNVTVSKDDEALSLAGATARLLDASAGPADAYSLANASTAAEPLACLAASTIQPDVYTAVDDSTPTPIPEPGLAAALAATAALAAAHLLLRKRG